MATHPAVAVAAAVAMPDPVFGERVCVFVELKRCATHSTCPTLVEHLLAQGVSKELLPERLEVLDELPRSSGGKIAKGQLREDIRSTLETIMTTEEVRRGGLEVWAPSKVPPIGVDLTDEQTLAVAFRHLADIGFAENMAGHITWQPDGQTDMYVNPWGLWWQELTASDICVVDEDARVVRGRWDVTPAIHLHTELHRQRPDARVVIHNHPYYVSLIAALGVLPELVHQTGSLFLDDMYLVEKYDGEIDAPWRAAELAEQIGSANLVHPGQPRRHHHRSQPRRGGLPGGVHRARLPAGLRRDGHRPDAVEDESRRHGGHAGVADRTRRRRVLGRRRPHDHQGRPRRSD